MFNVPAALRRGLGWPGVQFKLTVLKDVPDFCEQLEFSCRHDVILASIAAESPRPIPSEVNRVHENEVHDDGYEKELNNGAKNDSELELRVANRHNKGAIEAVRFEDRADKGIENVRDEGRYD